MNTYTLYNGSVYSCATSITIPESFNPTKWTLLGLQYDLFNAILPHPTFNIYGWYNIGDIVFWKNNVYTCKIATQPINHDAALAISAILLDNANATEFNDITLLDASDPPAKKLILLLPATPTAKLLFVLYT